MNLLLLFPDDFVTDSLVRLTDHRAKHVREVLRGYSGRELKVGLVNGGIGKGVIKEIDRQMVELEVILPQMQPEIPTLSLILALPRPQTLKKVLESTAAFGLKRLFLVNASRVDPSYFQSKLLKDESWRKHIYLGLEQGGKTFVPEITIHPSLKKLLVEKLDPSPRFVLQPNVSDTLWQSPLAHSNGREEILCAVGPEGGWQEEEVEIFRSHGFQAISLGSTTYRVENAVVAFLGQLELLSMRVRRSNPFLTKKSATISETRR